MTAQIIREATAGMPGGAGDSRAPVETAIIQVGGAKWFSAYPEGPGEAAAINADAREICDKVNNPFFILVCFVFGSLVGGIIKDGDVNRELADLKTRVKALEAAQQFDATNITIRRLSKP